MMIDSGKYFVRNVVLYDLQATCEDGGMLLRCTGGLNLETKLQICGEGGRLNTVKPQKQKQLRILTLFN
jgi:hypothetical protein